MSFAAPAFLIAILAGAIPVLLHMINRQKATEMPFSTLRFLKLSAQRTRRRKYVHDVLLMLLRVAALVLIAVALAKPVISQLGNLFGGNVESAIVIILDNSASMGTTDQQGVRWERAMDAAEKVMDQLGDNDTVALLTTCGPGRNHSNRLYANHENVRQALGATRLSFERADLAAQLQAARKLLEKSDAPNREIYVITDMQQASWPDAGHKTDNSDESKKQIPLIVIDLHSKPEPNVALRKIDLTAAAPVPGVPIQATVELVGDTNIAQKRHVELLVGGKRIDTSPTLDLAAGSTARHTFHFTLDQPGVHQGEIRLAGDDANATDNRLYFAVALDAHISVAVVRPKDHPIKYLEDTFYLERALMPVRSENWAIRVRNMTPTALATEPLSDYAVIYCVNLYAPDAAVCRRLGQYVQAGGHVVWICGENVDAGAYSGINGFAGQPLIPARLIAVRKAGEDHPDGWQIGWVDKTHPVLRPLSKPASLYQSVLVNKHIRLDAAGEGGARVLAKLSDGEPLLVERKVGDGSVLLLGTTAHVDWTNLPLRPLFLPLVARLTFEMADKVSASQQRICGVPINVSLPKEDRVDFVELRRPSGDVERLKPEDSTFHYTNTYVAGIYNLSWRSGPNDRRLSAAVNYDPDEVDPVILTQAELRKKFTDQALVFCDDPATISGTIRRLRQGDSIWEIFLLAVLIALVAEVYVANRRTSKEDPSEPVPRLRTSRRRSARDWTARQPEQATTT